MQRRGLWDWFRWNITGDGRLHVDTADHVGSYLNLSLREGPSNDALDLNNTGTVGTEE